MAVLIIFVLVAVRALSVEPGWNPRFAGRASLSQVKGTGGLLEVALDSTGWESLLADNGPLAYLRDYRSALGGEVRIIEAMEAAPPELPSKNFPGSPRAALRYGEGARQLRAELYQASSGMAVLSGPTEVTLSEPWLRSAGPGYPLTLLSTLPPGVERVVWLDYSCLSLPKSVTDKLTATWKKWEFVPQQRLWPALSPPFCYVSWAGQAVVMVGVSDESRVRAELDHRYPDSVIPKVARWSGGVRVEGLDWAQKPAWYFWGDRLVGVPSGGVDRLSEFVSRRQEQGEFSVTPAFDREFTRLARLEKSWHVCLIEKSSQSPVWWALLLRIDSKEDRRARGYLIVELRPRPGVEAKA